MPKKGHSPEEIPAKLPRVDVVTSRARSLGEAIGAIGAAESAHHRWRDELAGL
jgi:hypothetical protein